MISLRIGLLGASCVAVSVAAGVACSSSSNSTAPDSSSGGGSSSGSGSGGSSGSSGSSGGVVDGDGGPCAIAYPHTTGTFITMTVSWPGTTATVKGTDQPYYLWILSTYSVPDGGTKITGTNTTCGSQSPDVPLSATGSFAVGAPTGTTALVQSTFPAGSWTGVPTSRISGVVGGSNLGSSFETDPNVTLNGIALTDPLADPTTPWPTKEASLNPADLTYFDGTPYSAAKGGHPGIHGYFTSTSPYYLSSTALSPTSPRADQLWIVSRTQIGLSGTRKTCQNNTPGTPDIEGTADVKLIQNRIVGCEIVNDGGPCSEAEYAFIDTNTTQYVPGAGTFQAKDLSDTATCADVLSAFPAPTK
jgi:hypothetical protein